MNQAFRILITSLAMTSMVSISLAQDVVLDPEDVQLGKAEYSPYLDHGYPDRVYFGDTHVHTSYSTDAGMLGTRLGARGSVSFRAGRGSDVEHGRPRAPAP